MSRWEANFPLLWVASSVLQKLLGKLILLPPLSEHFTQVWIAWGSLVCGGALSKREKT